MSDLVKRLSLLADSIELGDKLRWGEDSAALREAKDRIEELEAKLAKAVKALRGWIDFANAEGMPVLLSDLEAAELTGQGQ